LSAIARRVGSGRTEGFMMIDFEFEQDQPTQEELMELEHMEWCDLNYCEICQYPKHLFLAEQETP
jgi:hypothetical protein